MLLTCVRYDVALLPSVALLAACICSTPNVWAQRTTSNALPDNRLSQPTTAAVAKTVPGGSDREQALGGLGGGGLADFSQLMALIQQTIDPNAWIDASSTMNPFPSGVYIDPQGQMRHVSNARALPVSLKSRPLNSPTHASQSSGLAHPWRNTSDLRVISLRKLDQALAWRTAKGLRTTQEFDYLAGLSRIEYVFVDEATEDVLLAGPANGHQRATAKNNDAVQNNTALDATVQGFHLIDLALLIDLLNSRSLPLGCSIDPTDEGILAAQQLLKPAGALKRLAIDPQKFVGQMQDKIGPHHVRVFGMPAGSPAAVALVAADEHMKQLGFGNTHTSIPIESYFDHLDKQTDVPSQSLIRWWFTFANEPIRANAQRNLFQLPRQCVALLSEQQWVSMLGRKATGKHDPSADAFATSMTAGMAELRKVHPDYARMVALFESTLALQLVLEASGQHDLHDWFPSLTHFANASYQGQTEPKTVSGLTTWHKLKNGTVVAVVSGGVRIDPRELTTESHWEMSSVSVDLQRESTSVEVSRECWWWD